MRCAALVRGVLSAAILAAIVGCSGQEAEEKPTPRPPVATDVAPPAADRVETPEPDEPAVPTAQTPAQPAPPPAAPTMPPVVLSAAYREMCVVLTGDPMPEGELADATGQTVKLDALRGERLTVVFFFENGDTPDKIALAATALEDLAVEVVEPFAAKGAKVVAINVGAGADAVGEAAAKAPFPVLSDPEGKYFAKVGSVQLPRVYVLDAAGKIMWFDLEFSRTTRRDLHRAILAMLAE
jgi:peroxiredoxin